MKTLLFVALASLAVSTANAQNRITVHLYNLSGMSNDTLHRSTREASRAFAQVNVIVDWEPGDPQAEEAHSTDQSGPNTYEVRVRPYLVVRIGRGLAFHVPSGALGISLPNAQFGVSATIFQERVESLSESTGRDFALMLGYALAHELGHLTLASDAHAPTGIMRARWGRNEFDLAATGGLGFTPKQGNEIRAYGSQVALLASR